MSKPLTFVCKMNNTIKDVLLSRGYTEIIQSEEEDSDSDADSDSSDDPNPKRPTESSTPRTDWDLIWASQAWVLSNMLGQGTLVLRPSQRVNHFPNSFELTRKDLMAKNLQRLKRELRKTGQDSVIDFAPTTFVLPTQFAMFLEDMKKKEGPWICKPVAGSMGTGIVFFQTESEAKSFNSKNSAKFREAEDAQEKMNQTYVVQRYILNPLLIGGRKFDMRFYALALSFSPLIVYIYRSGFCRFSSQPFTLNSFDRDIHLTNIAVQTHSEAYNPRHGCKWDLFSLRNYIGHRFDADAENALFAAMNGIILNSLISVAPAMIQDKHCYELYGYDILIASDLRPWLIEINASPSLDANTEDDYDLKFSFLNEMLDLVQIFQAKDPETELPRHYGVLDLAGNNGPVMPKAPTSTTSYVGCLCPIKRSANNPFRTESHFQVKKIPGHPH
jgi:tubulin polyglutamylase TTLL9